MSNKHYRWSYHLSGHVSLRQASCHSTIWSMPSSNITIRSFSNRSTSSIEWAVTTIVFLSVAHNNRLMILVRKSTIRLVARSSRFSSSISDNLNCSNRRAIWLVWFRTGLPSLRLWLVTVYSMLVTQTGCAGKSREIYDLHCRE